MKHPQPAVSKHAVKNMEVLTRQGSSQEFIHVIEPTLTADFEGASCHHLIEVFRSVSMMKRRGSEDHFLHAAMLVMAIPIGKHGRKRFCRKNFAVIVNTRSAMLSTIVLVERRVVDGVQVASFSAEDYPMGDSVVCGVPDLISPIGRDEAGDHDSSSGCLRK